MIHLQHNTRNSGQGPEFESLIESVLSDKHRARESYLELYRFVYEVYITYITS